MALTQSGRTVVEYKVEFNRLVKFSLKGIKDNERTKIQKFIDGLSLKLQHDTQGFDVATLGGLINKAKWMEESAIR